MTKISDRPVSQDIFYTSKELYFFAVFHISNFTVYDRNQNHLSDIWFTLKVFTWDTFNVDEIIVVCNNGLGMLLGLRYEIHIAFIIAR